MIANHHISLKETFSDYQDIFIDNAVFLTF